MQSGLPQLLHLLQPESVLLQTLLARLQLPLPSQVTPLLAPLQCQLQLLLPELLQCVLLPLPLSLLPEPALQETHQLPLLPSLLHQMHHSHSHQNSSQLHLLPALQQ